MTAIASRVVPVIATGFLAVLNGCGQPPANSSNSSSATTSKDGKACVFTAGGPRPQPPTPSGANEKMTAVGGEVVSLSDSFVPVWGRICLQNGRDAVLAISSRQADGNKTSFKLMSASCADINTTAASIRSSCVNDQDSTCVKYTYTMVRRCNGGKAEVVEVASHAAHFYYRFDVNPSAYDFMRKAQPVRANKVWNTPFVVSSSLATVEICWSYPDAAVVATLDEAGIGPDKKVYQLRDQSKCFVAQGRNISVRLTAPYPPHNVFPPTVLTYRMLSYKKP